MAKKKNKHKNYHFEKLPQIKKRQSAFRDPYSHITTYNTGQLIPIMCKEILPGDNITDFKLSSIQRLQTLIDPIFSSMFYEVNAFFVPNRIIWEHWQNFCGQNDTDAWTDSETYSVPQLIIPENGFRCKSLADYLGVPINVGAGKKISALPFRAYAKVVNDFYRNENINDPCYCPVNDEDLEGSNGTDLVLDVVKGGTPYIVGKQKDLFTSCLPEPQKGDPVPLPMGNLAPVITSDTVSWYSEPIKFANDKTAIWSGYHNVGAFTDNDTKISTPYTSGSSSGLPSPAVPFVGSNLVTDLSEAIGANVNDLRFSFQLQKILELNARYGTRYIEYLYSHFGVVSSDSRLQRAEWLGGARNFVNVNQVLQNSESNQTPLGDTAGYSLTPSFDKLFRHSFEEHGYLLVLVTLKYNHSYDQGLPKMFSRENLYDFYDPMLAHIGEQPILNKEIYFQGNNDDDEVFGYNEAWAHYRYTPNQISGAMRTKYDLSLSSWHLGDSYDELPTLSPDFIREDKANVDRVIAVSSEVENQVLAQFYFDYTINRSMPLYSVPGLIDHF